MPERSTRTMERRRFLGMTALALPATTGSLALGRTQARGAVHEGYPRNDPERVQAVVGASHGNLERVRELVQEQPALAKASWDWGFGDWETALGAASHVGRPDIAELLIAHGARPTLFSAAMMGQVDTVRAYLDADPGLHLLAGPHGIPLEDHARAGRERALPVLDYLMDRFGPDERVRGLQGGDELDRRYGGAYGFEDAPELRLAVGVRDGWLLVGAGEAPTSRVLQVADDVFHPRGAPAVRLSFEVVDGRARTVMVTDGPTRLLGRRL